MSDNIDIIVQDTISDIIVNSSTIVETIDIVVEASAEEITIVSNPNDYIVNINRVIGEQVQSDWDVTIPADPAFIKNKPTIPAAQVNSDWNAVSGIAEILNKPTIPAAVTNTSELINDGEDGVNPFITAQDLPAAQVNSDWNATSGVAEILNKPTIPAAVTNTSDLINDGADGVNPFITALDIPTTGQASTIVREVKNMTGSTLTKGSVVYISGANGNKILVSKAQASSESLSSRTFGLLQSNILNNGVGYCVVIGDISGLNTSSFTEGAQLYLSPTTAGTYTTTKPSAPDHLVYIGKITRSHPTQGQIEVQIQNGYELQELHNVAINGVSNNQLLAFDSSTSLWKNKSITTAEIADSTNKRYVTDANLVDFNTAYQSKINSAAFSGTEIKTLTLSQQSGGTITANFSIYDSMEIFYNVSTLQDRTIADGGTFESKKCLFNQLSNLNNI
jgi:hypothetical protein